MFRHSGWLDIWYVLKPVANTAGETNPEVESVPGLFLRVDTVDLGPAHCPNVGLVALFEVDEL